MAIAGNSTFFEYAARSLWRIQARRDTDEPSFDLGFYHEKSNNSRRFRPIGYRIEVDDVAGTIRVRPQDVRQVPELAEAAGYTEESLEAALQELQPASEQTLAAYLGESVGRVRSGLFRLEERRRIVRFRGVGGSQWSLLDVIHRAPP